MADLDASRAALPSPWFRWQFYVDAAGRCPAREFLDELSPGDAAVVKARMAVVGRVGPRAAAVLTSQLREVQASREGRKYRVVFSGERDRTLLVVDALETTTRRTPRGRVILAQQRVDDWRSRRARSRPRPEASRGHDRALGRTRP